MGQRGSENLSHHGDIVALVDDLHALLGPQFIKEDAYRGLADIFHRARAFEIMRRKVKSKVEICFGACDDAGIAQRYNMSVDNSLMRIRNPRVIADLEDSKPGPGPTVKLVVSPAIVRWGNSNGVDYDLKTCLVKMDVLFSQAPKIVSQAPAEQAQLAGYGQVDQRSNGGAEGRHSMRNNNASGRQIGNFGPSPSSNQNTQYTQAPKIKKEMHTGTGYSTPPHPSGQSTRQGQAISRSISTGQTFRSRSAAQEGTRKRRASEFEQRSLREELSGGPDDYKNTRNSKPSTFKKLRSGGGGNSRR